MRFSICLAILLILSVAAIADNIPSPPPLATLPSELQHYLKSIQENLHRLAVVTTNPDGVRNGKKGDMVLLEVDGGAAGDKFYLEVNVDSSKQWSGVQLLNLP